MKDIEKARAFHFFLFREVMRYMSALQCLWIVWRWQGPVVACCLRLNATTLCTREYAFAVSGLFANQWRTEDVEEMLFLSPRRIKRRLGECFPAVLGLGPAPCAIYFFCCQSHPRLFRNVPAIFLADQGPICVYMLEVSFASQLIQHEYRYSVHSAAEQLTWIDGDRLVLHIDLAGAWVGRPCNAGTLFTIHA